MHFLAGLWAAMLDRLQNTFGSASPALLGALLISVLYYIDRSHSRGCTTSIKGFFRSTIASRIVLHPSSLVDMRTWVVNCLVLATAHGMLALGMFFWRDTLADALTRAFGAHQPTAWPTWLILTMATIFQLLAYELANWFSHYLFQRYPALWEFHKAHHFAEVMTTFTDLRQHPVEILAFDRPFHRHLCATATCGSPSQVSRANCCKARRITRSITPTTPPM